MKILILNWRDPQSTLEGGAERFTKVYGEYWATKKHEVYWLTNSFPKAKSSETLNGIRYLRISPSLDGSLIQYIFFYPIYLLKTIWFARNFIKQEKVDIVIDEIHGLPFFTPLYSKARNILLVCEIAGPIWKKMFPVPVGSIGIMMEKIIYRLYRKCEIWAISNNTKRDVLDILSEAKVNILQLGIDQNKAIQSIVTKTKKTKYPSAIFLARLVKMKGIEVAIKTSASVVKKIPNFKLFVVGDGNSEYLNHLVNLVRSLNMQENVMFLGKLPELEKYNTLRKAHILLHPSYKEGFGLTVLEANAVGTPAIVRKGSSLDELVVDGKTGFVFKNENDISVILTDYFSQRLRRRFSVQTRKNAQRYLWPTILAQSNELL